LPLASDLSSGKLYCNSFIVSFSVEVNNQSRLQISCDRKLKCKEYLIVNNNLHSLQLKLFPHMHHQISK